MKIALIITLLTILTTFVVVFLSPQWGGATDSASIAMTGSANFRDRKFHNIVSTNLKISAKKMMEHTVEFLKKDNDRVPPFPLPTGKTIDIRDDRLKVTWFGHSTCLIEIDGLRVLTDPIFSHRASPFTFMGPRSFEMDRTMDIEELPQVDIVVISHDHYDHLDYETISALKAGKCLFYVPLGVGNHLKRWGVEPSRVFELDWWQGIKAGVLTLTATPSRHFSGRTLTNRDETLWASWVIEGKEKKIFFSGDSGYFDGFREIGERYGPFDLTLMESGAYNEDWADIHMMPEDSVQAHRDIGGKFLLPIHWGKFDLSTHSWNEPVERLLKEADRDKTAVITPRIGETFYLEGHLPYAKWWRDNPF